MTDSSEIDPAFQVHTLNDRGKEWAQKIAEAFDRLLSELSELAPPDRDLSIVRTKLEEACFFAKKAIASRPENQQQ